MKHARKTIIAGSLVLVAVAGLYALVDRWISSNELSAGLIQANGRIEGDRVTVSSKFPGRVRELLTREGATVTVDQVMVRLDDTQTRAQVEQARQAWAALEAQFQGAHTDLAILNLDVPLAIEAADERVREERAKLAKALAVEKDARIDARRYRDLYARDNATQQELDRADTKWNVARNDVAASRAELARASRELAQAELGWKRIRAKESEVEALERQRDRAEAALEEAESILADLTIRAPINGTITTRMADVGEFANAGTPLFELVNLDQLYLKVYVPEIQIGKVRLGLPARIYTDAFPDQPFPATVRYIASRAEFTPKEVQTPDERVKLVYEARLYLTENPEHRLTPGLPADAVIRWQGDVEWQKPKW